nr:MAG TPA_asm: hypothetical protein [Caudoviricetes sp.]
MHHASFTNIRFVRYALSAEAITMLPCRCQPPQRLFR